MSPTLEHAVNAADKRGRLAMEHIGMDLGKRESQIDPSPTAHPVRPDEVLQVARVE